MQSISSTSIPSPNWQTLTMMNYTPRTSIKRKQTPWEYWKSSRYSKKGKNIALSRTNYSRQCHVPNWNLRLKQITIQWEWLLRIKPRKRNLWQGAPTRRESTTPKACVTTVTMLMDAARWQVTALIQTG